MDRYYKVKALQSGVTLLELMIVIVIVGVLAALAGPAFQESIQRNRKLFTMEELLSTLSQARTEAVSRSVAVHVCPSADSASCIASSNNWTSGIIAFEDDGGDGGTANDGVRHPSEQMISITTSFASGIEIYGPDPNTPLQSAFLFTSDGSNNQPGTLRICDDDGDTGASAIVVGRSGQLRIAVD